MSITNTDKKEYLKFCPRCPKDPKNPSKASLLFYNNETKTVFCINCGFTIDYPLSVYIKENLKVVESVEFDPKYNKEMIQKTKEETHKRNLEVYKNAPWKVIE